MNLFSIRFLEPELDDYIMYAFTFPVLVFLKKRGINPILFAFPLVIFYAIFHGSLGIGLMGFGEHYYLEISRTPTVYFYILPALYLLYTNKRFLELILLLILSTIWMTPKYVTNALPILVFASYLNLKDIKFNEGIIGTFLGLFLFAMIIFPIIEVNDKIEAFKKFCNPKEKICYNYNPGSWHYGHYFAWLGYITVNPSHYGLCCCTGMKCLNKTLNCGLQ